MATPPTLDPSAPNPNVSPHHRKILAVAGALKNAQAQGVHIQGWVVVQDDDPALTTANFWQLEFRPSVKRLFEFCTGLEIFSNVHSFSFDSASPAQEPLVAKGWAPYRLVAIKVDSRSRFA